MAYPKPLSERSIQKMYADSGLTKKQIGFLHRFVAACANLYGVIRADEAWKVYQSLRKTTDTVRIMQKSLYQVLGIFRRMDLPYRIYEIDEVYSAEKRSDGHRLIIHCNVFGVGYHQFANVYNLNQCSYQTPCAVPEDLLYYAQMPVIEEEKALLKMLEELQSVDGEYKTRNGQISPCPSEGKHLNEFSVLTERDQMNISILRSDGRDVKEWAARADEIKRHAYSVPASQHLLDDLKRSVIGGSRMDYMLNHLLEDLYQMGVAFAEEEDVRRITMAVLDVMNHERTWPLRGNTRIEMHEILGPESLSELNFVKGGKVHYTVRRSF